MIFYIIIRIIFKDLSKNCFREVYLSRGKFFKDIQKIKS